MTTGTASGPERPPARRATGTANRGSREKMLAALWATAKSHGIPEARVYQVCSSTVGRVLVKGFGLSTCTHQELIRCVDAVKREAGEFVTAKAPRPPRPERHAPCAMRLPPNVVRIATVGQLQKARALERELKIGMDEAAGIARRATGVAHPRTSKDVGRYTEALKAIRARRQKASFREEPSAARSG